MCSGPLWSANTIGHLAGEVAAVISAGGVDDQSAVPPDYGPGVQPGESVYRHVLPLPCDGDITWQGLSLTGELCLLPLLPGDVVRRCHYHGPNWQNTAC